MTDTKSIMERASKVIRGLRLSGEVISAEEVACAAWPDAVGKKVAAHTRAARLIRTRLVVEVEDATWQRQMLALSPHILLNLERGLGASFVQDLEFRVVPRRREPQQARQAMPTVFADDADAIVDPVMRRIYKAARKRAQA